MAKRVVLSRLLRCRRLRLGFLSEVILGADILNEFVTAASEWFSSSLTESSCSPEVWCPEGLQQLNQKQYCCFQKFSPLFCPWFIADGLVAFKRSFSRFGRMYHKRSFPTLPPMIDPPSSSNSIETDITENHFLVILSRNFPYEARINFLFSLWWEYWVFGRASKVFLMRINFSCRQFWLHVAQWIFTLLATILYGEKLVEVSRALFFAPKVYSRYDAQSIILLLQLTKMRFRYFLLWRSTNCWTCRWLARSTGDKHEAVSRTR